MYIRLIATAALGVVALLLASCTPNTFSTYVDYKRQHGVLQGPYYLPRTLLTLTITTTGTDDTITAAKKVAPDPNAKLLYRFEPSGFSDDTLEVQTDESGLLNSVSSLTTDRSGDIAVKIAETLFTVATRGAALPTADAPVTKTIFQGTFDPFDQREKNWMKSELAGRKFCILVGTEVASSPDTQCGVKPSPPQGVGSSAAFARSIDKDFEYPEIFYRRTKPTPIRVLKYNDAMKKWDTVWYGQESIFDKSELYEVALSRSEFIKRQTVLTFTNGALTGIKLDKPSEVLAAVSIPVKILRIAFAIPLAGLQQETASVKAQTDLADQQSKLINAQTSLLKLQIKQANGSLLASP
jgi:hypothetical protein